MKVKVTKKEEQEVPIRRVTSKELKKELKRFEDKYSMSSKEFYEKFKKGKIAETRETVNWYIAYRFYLRSIGKDVYGPKP